MHISGKIRTNTQPSSQFSGFGNIKKVRNTYELLNNSAAALVTSGTATLETALFGVPQVICYKGSKISYMIARKLISIKYIGLVNLIMDKEVVKELIQNDFNEKNLKKELEKILHDKNEVSRIRYEYSELNKLLSQGGNASANAAKSVFEIASSKSI